MKFMRNNIIYHSDQDRERAELSTMWDDSNICLACNHKSSVEK